MYKRLNDGIPIYEFMECQRLCDNFCELACC